MILGLVETIELKSSGRYRIVNHMNYFSNDIVLEINNNLTGRKSYQIIRTKNTSRVLNKLV